MLMGNVMMYLHWWAKWQKLQTSRFNIKFEKCGTSQKHHTKAAKKKSWFSSASSSNFYKQK